MAALAGLDDQQVQKAVVALVKYSGKNKVASNNLLEEEDDLLYLTLALKKTPNAARKDKPIPLSIPHPIFKFAESEVCLLVKDTSGEGHKAAKKKVKAIEGTTGITKVIGISKLRTKYESHEAKRQLCNSYDLFLADDRVLPSLPKLVGKSFFKKKKQPIPVDLRKKDWVAQVKKACCCTYLIKSGGTCLNIKVGLTSFAPKEVVENVRAALEQAVKHIPKGWNNVQSLFLKTAESAALPVYQTLPAAPTKFK